jgi:hypothetical protein
LDLQSLSQMTSSVSAFQVLTIGDLGEANLYTSLRSFLRYVTSTPNDTLQDGDKEKKRKRASGVSTDNVSQSSIPPRSSFDNGSPPKRSKNEEDGVDEVRNQILPKSIESLYASILSAEKEIEAGRSWNGELLSDM